jgi:hypothetical protein
LNQRHASNDNDETLEDPPNRIKFKDRLTAPRLLPRIWNRFLTYFYYYPDQWVILLALNPQKKMLSWSDFKLVLPSPDRDWADPFVIFRDGRYFIFIEEKLYTTNRGRIVCLMLGETLEVESSRVVLERPYHLSYPFLFEHKGQLFMIPETAQNHQIEIYSCVRFPDQWKFEKPLIKDVDAVDATIIDHNGKWWLFANVIETGGTSWDTLNLYFSDDPLSSDWTPHPQNPIIKNIHTARPAGNIQRKGKDLTRPSQDCSVRYGYATNFNHISTLTETDYAESIKWTYEPTRKGPFVAVHTWNQANDLVAIDAILRRRRSFRLSHGITNDYVSKSKQHVSITSRK